MALTVPQITAATAFQATRAGQPPIVWTIQQDLAEAAKLFVPESVAHNRTKVEWQPGDKVTIFLSKDDDNKVNGFYFSWEEDEPTYLTSADVSWFSALYLYQFDFGSNDTNSERQFLENVSTFLTGLSRLGSIQGKLYMGRTGKAFLTTSGGVTFHLWRGRLRFRICDL
jgi:hypothetical protein